MKLVKDSSIVLVAKDYYVITNFVADRVNKIVRVKLIYVEHNHDGTVELQYVEKVLQDVRTFIIDPEWDVASGKPVNFDATDPTTWGALSWDDIPRVEDSSKLYASHIITASESEGANTDQAIFEALIAANELPGDEKWRFIC